MRLVPVTSLVSHEQASHDVMLPSACTSVPTQFETKLSQPYDASDPLGAGSPQANLQANGPVPEPASVPAST